MKIVSTNIAKPTNIIWNGKKEITGIYKRPTNNPVFLGKNEVKDDEVTDRKHHGGEFKACYLFSENHYAFWENLYPNLDWHWGMFGENLTVKNLDETQIQIGTIYKIGDALVEVTQPREPCFKLGLKFGTQTILKQFIEYGLPGTYVRVLKEGFVKTGDTLQLVKNPEKSITTEQFFKLLYSKEKNQEHLSLVIKLNALPLRKREKLKQFIK